jgi:transcriptional regulator with PAS, ATPase and Fis domain
MVRKGLFMPDLYDRLNVFKFPIPPLRDRKEDIPLLIDHFIRKFGYSHGLDFGNLRVAHDFIKNLKSLDWKGNVRTLENAIKEIVARRIATQNRSEIRVDDLPTFITMSEETILSKPKKKLPGNTKITDQQLIECLKTCDNNKTSAAKKLGVDPCTIHRRIKKINESSNPT